jgi:hypothetical protein
MTIEWTLPRRSLEITGFKSLVLRATEEASVMPPRKRENGENELAANRSRLAGAAAYGQ